MTNRAAKSAFGPMTMVVAEQRRPAEQRLVHDGVAHRLLPPSLRLVMTLARWRPLENLLVSAAEQTAKGKLYGADVAYRRFKLEEKVWKFALDPADVPGLLVEHGWRELEQVGPREFTERYLEPLGRALAVSEIERSVYAEKG